MMPAALLAMAVLLQLQAATPDLSGTWSLDTYLSDNPEQVLASIRADLRPQGSSIFSEAPDTGSFGRGRARGRRDEPHSASASKAAPPQDVEDQRALDAITAGIRYPPPTLKISAAPGSVTLVNDQGASRTFHTTGKREPQLFDTAPADTTAEWEGPQLVITFDLGKGRKMTYTYSIVPTTHQLSLRVMLERAPNQPGPFEIRYVYNRVDQG